MKLVLLGTIASVGGGFLLATLSNNEDEHFRIHPREFDSTEYAAKEKSFREGKIADAMRAVETIANTLAELKNDPAKKDQAERLEKGLEKIKANMAGLKGIMPAAANNKLCDDTIAFIPPKEWYEAENLFEYEDLTKLIDDLKIRWEPNTELVAKGSAIYRDMCMTCHGVDGNSVQITPETLRSADGNEMYARDFSGASHVQGKVVFKFSNAKSSPALEEDLRNTIQNGLPGTPMAGYSGLESEKLDALVEFIKTFGYVDWKYRSGGGKIVEAVPQVPEDLRTLARAERGRKVYETLCLACHGDIEHGGKPDTGKVLDWVDWKEYREDVEALERRSTNPADYSEIFKKKYLKAEAEEVSTEKIRLNKEDYRLPIAPRNFAVEPLRKGRESQLFLTLRNGIKGTPMPANPSLAEGEVWDVISYVLYLRKLASEGKLPVKK